MGDRITIRGKGEALRVINVAPFGERKIAPPLTLGSIVNLHKTYICGCGENHLDVGLISEYNFITCHKCYEELPDGENIHWAHASRFEFIN